MTTVQAVLSALEVFSRAPEKAALEQANTWLQDFQHSSEAWATCNVLLLSPDVPPAAKLFAAQTFRTKVTYDLHEMNDADLLSLRDTLLRALETYHAEELNTNIKIPLTDDEYKERAAKLLTANASKVTDLLSMYLQASGISFAVQTQIFNCLSSWLAAGEVTAISLAHSPLLPFSFDHWRLKNSSTQQ
ncbi:hypothetical protein A0H81_00837 [Grifola frondosa]|uniref:Importin N-terminal domain-containing protein n=1 Tax=Grifola frondosa TaxID=5627 RepID=A0A1C7MP12_GRIFR|nr:hypothetical protein A0H81_00837 [Grifola frondosa]